MVTASNSNIRWLLQPETYYDPTMTMPLCVLHVMKGYTGHVIIGFYIQDKKIGTIK